MHRTLWVFALHLCLLQPGTRNKYHLIYCASMAWICASICSLVKRPIVMVLFGQWEAHSPHPLQEAEIVSAFLPSGVSTTRMAL